MNRSSSFPHRRRPSRLSGPGVLKPLLLGLLAVAPLAQAIAPTAAPGSPLQPSSRSARSFVAPELNVQPSLEATARIGADTRQHASTSAFLRNHPGTWDMRWDTRGDRPNMIQGSGIPLVPGRGNSLSMAKLGLAATEKSDLAVIEARLLDFLKSNGDLLKTDGLEFELDTQRSMPFGENDSHWNVQFQQTKNGVPVQGANLFFRISNGNIIQFGSTKVGNVAVDTQPTSSAQNAFALAWAELAPPKGAVVSEVLQPGELQLLPYAPDGADAGEEYKGVAGQGYAHRLAWRFVFRIANDTSTYEVLVDAKTNHVIEVRDLTASISATVDGGVFPIDQPNTVAEVIQPMPFASVTNGSARITDALGIYDYAGGSASITLNGKYVQISDACGSISLSNSTDGNLHLGTSTGTDCGSSGTGGAGNTRSSRNAFRYLTAINRKAATFFPNNNWLNGKVTAKVNGTDQVCNAYWDGTALNFMKKSQSGSAVCANTGELPGVFLHEFGHGIQQNVGGSPVEMGTGEATGDTFAMLETRSGCVGTGFYIGTSYCHNCSAACTGVRDINQFSSHGPGTVIAKPSNITAAGGPDCSAYKSQVDGKSCPYLVKTLLGSAAYQGPMGYEGHCESYIASGANWDLAQALASQYGETQGWAKMDSLWYQSLPSNTSAYRLASGGKCNTAATVDGCASNNWYNLYLAADDDDGNLANGTPNACRIWDAFNAHGIACGARPACSGGGTTNVPPVANFSSSTNGLTATFTDTSTDSDGTIASRSWTFGDGGTSTLANPSHAYAAAGTYSVTLTVKDNGGATNAKTASVTVTGSSANVPPLANFTSATNGLTATFTDTSTDSDGTVASRAWTFGDGGTSTVANPSHTYASAGTYNVTLTVTDNGGATNARTAQVTVTAPTSGTTVLQNGVAVNSLSAAVGTDLFFTLDVPAGATGLTFKSSGGSGDADLYVKFNGTPTLTSYDCVGGVSTTANETCSIATAQAGIYTVMLHAYTAFSGVSLVGSYAAGGSGGSVLQNGVAVTGVSAPLGGYSTTYTIVVPAGKAKLTVTTSGGTGDGDLYVRLGSAPTTSSYSCASGVSSGNAESCSIYFPTAGTYHIRVYGYTAASGITLKAAY